MLALLRSSIVAFALLTLLTGLLYPLAVTGVAHVAFHDAAHGSLLVSGDTVVGSRLLGQPFTRPDYFWGRLSATAPFPYNAGSSTASNLGPTNPAESDAAKARIDALHAADGTASGPIPVDLVTASGSGLDPDISYAAAEYQVPRVARARGLTTARVEELVSQARTRPLFGFLGEDRVNVVALNGALEAR
jgi:potassium-transporting ATPase KdpC subunit